MEDRDNSFRGHEQNEQARQGQYDRFGSRGFGSQAQVADASGLTTFLGQVYGLMFAALMITAASAWTVFHSVTLFQAVVPNIWLLFIVELGLVFWLSARVHQMSATSAGLVFFGYSVVNGFTLAPLVYSFTEASVATAFMVTAGTFGLMAVWGLATKKDISSWGSYLMMGLFGLILAIVVNMFMQNPMIDTLISCFAVFIFVGLTAWDNQRIKATWVPGMESTAEGIKFAVMGALMLYLDFVNLFVHLLSLFGDRD